MFRFLSNLFASEAPARQTPHRFRPGVDSLETRECPSSLGDDFCGNVPRWPLPPRSTDVAVLTSQPATVVNPGAPAGIIVIGSTR